MSQRNIPEQPVHYGGVNTCVCRGAFALAGVQCSNIDCTKRRPRLRVSRVREARWFNEGEEKRQLGVEVASIAGHRPMSDPTQH